jgi:hypothetical protein
VDCSNAHAWLGELFFNFQFSVPRFTTTRTAHFPTPLSDRSFFSIFVHAHAILAHSRYIQLARPLTRLVRIAPLLILARPDPALFPPVLRLSMYVKPHFLQVGGILRSIPPVYQISYCASKNEYICWTGCRCASQASVMKYIWLYVGGAMSPRWLQSNSTTIGL